MSLLLLLLTCSLTACTSDGSEESRQPNILLITADDLGYDDLAFHGNPDVTTPYLDQLAKQSVRFDDFNVTPVCATTRASLLTGRQHYKTGVSGVHGGRDFMSLEETTLADLLSDNGYATGMWGKWHTGKTKGYYPWDRGFQEGYYAELYRHENNSGLLNGKAVKHNKWASEVIVDYTLDFMKRHKDQPFFAYASFLAPHGPWKADAKHIQPYLEKGYKPSIATLYGMISEMDHEIGRLLDYLESSGLDKNTLVIFLSDNGPANGSPNFGEMTQAEWDRRNPSDYNGLKGKTWQNGIKSPLFIYQNGKLSHKLVKRYTTVSDLLPTLLELTGIELPENNLPLDGISFVNYIEGDTSSENPRMTYIGNHDVHSTKAQFNQWSPIDAEARKLMQYENQYLALRTERFKLMLNPHYKESHYPRAKNRYVLIDMQSDPREQTNVIEKYPEIAKKLIQKLEQEFEALHTSPTAFQAPIFTIGGDEPAFVINAFGASSIGGQTLQLAHHLNQVGQPGDFSKYHIRVVQPGDYKVYATRLRAEKGGVEISLSTAGDSLSKTLNGERTEALGVITLQASDTELRLDVIANHSQDQKETVDQLRRFYFIPADSPATPADLPMNW